MNQISPKASIYGNVEIGDNVRIDDFSILTGDIKIGSNVHIGAFCLLLGKEGIVIEDYAQISHRGTILTRSDDYSGLSMVGPTVPDDLKIGLDRGPVVLKRHVILGVSTIVMPWITIGEGTATGAFTFINKDLMPWSIYVGCPAKWLKPRAKRILELEKEFERRIHERG